MRRFAVVPAIVARSGVLLVLALALTTKAEAGPVVYFTVSAAPAVNVWTIDVTVTNNIQGMNIYFFGVAPTGVGTFRAETLSPAGWNTYDQHWSNASAGGSRREYANVWMAAHQDSELSFGSSLSGFTVALKYVYSPERPTDIYWFAYAVDAENRPVGLGTRYEGDDYFSNPYNPGFEGIALERVATVPGPASTLFLLGMGLAGLGAARRRSRQHSRLR